MMQERKPKFPLEKVSDAERTMIEGALSGDDVDLAQYAEEKQKKAQIRADVLRDLILGRYGPVHERGVRIRKAHIPDQLDLSHCTVRFPLVLCHCIFGTEKVWQDFCEKYKWDDGYKEYLEQWRKVVPLMLDRATLHFVQLDGSTFHGGLSAERAGLGSGLYINAIKTYGHIYLPGSNIKGHINANNIIVEKEEGVGINLQGIKILGDVLLRNSQCYSQVDISGAEIRGQLSAENIRFFGDMIISFDISNSNINEGLFLNYAKFSGALDMRHAIIKGYAFICNAKFNGKGISINAERGKIFGNFFLENSDFFATVWLSYIEIDGQLIANNARFLEKNNDAIRLQGAKVKGGLFIDEAIFFHEPGVLILK